MYLAEIVLFCFIVSKCGAEKIPWCLESSSNPGVMKFGPLPSGLQYSHSNYEQLQKRIPLPTYQLQGTLYRYVVQYAEYTESLGASSSYITLYYKDMDVCRVIDYLKVNPNIWKDFEKAILDADYQTNRDLTIRVKFLEADCDCIMMVYDLTSNDIPASAKSVPCGTVTAMNNPYKLTKIETHLTTPSNVFIIDEFTKYPVCTVGTTFGVYKEFGLPHPHLVDPAYFTPVGSPGVTSQTLTGDLWKYKVDFTEYREQPTVGNGDYGYVVLSFDGSDLSHFKPSTGVEYRVIDYLRVDPSNWRMIQDAILEGSHSASTNWRLRVKYLTKDCDCVMRVYDLRQADIPGTAETRACNGYIMMGYPHLLQGEVHKSATLTPPTPTTAKYPGCDPRDNFGVLDEFGPLPGALTLGDHYRPNIYTNIANTQFQLEGPLTNFRVEYKEFEDKYPLGTGIYAYLILNYNDGVQNLVLDYIRVNHYLWQEIENAIVDVHILSDGKIRLQFLMSDCSCVTREYNPKITEFIFRGKTIPCPSPLGALPARKTTQLTGRKL